METEVHVYGFSIAVNVLLSFFPFLIVIYSVCRQMLGWRAATLAIGFVLDDYFPGELNNFVSGNLQAAVSSRRTLPFVSVLLLLFTANGIFEPLEVAFNKVWGITPNRSFVRNQVVSLGLIFACGTLGLASTVLTAINARAFGGDSLTALFAPLFFKMAALPVTILILFLVYWVLPNAKIRWQSVLPAAVVAGVALEALKYVNLVTWPLWRDKLHAEYGPFYYSVTIVLWSFLGAMIILGGAEWAARRARAAAAAAN